MMKALIKPMCLPLDALKDAPMCLRDCRVVRGTFEKEMLPQ